MKKFFLLLIAAGMSIMPVKAQVGNILGIGNHLGVDVNVGTTGYGFEISTPLTQWVQARAGISIMPGIKFHVDTDVTGSYSANGQVINYSEPITLHSNLSRVQGSLIFNVYPLGNHFPLFVAAGAYFGGKKLMNIKGHVPDEVVENGGGMVEIGDYHIPVDPNGDVRGSLRVNSFRPYFGIGTGRPCPKSRLNFMWELGVQLEGKPKVFSDYGEAMEINGLDNDDTYHDIIKYLKVYPVLKFTLSGKIF